MWMKLPAEVRRRVEQRAPSAALFPQLPSASVKLPRYRSFTFLLNISRIITLVSMRGSMMVRISPVGVKLSRRYLPPNIKMSDRGL